MVLNARFRGKGLARGLDFQLQVHQGKCYLSLTQTRLNTSEKFQKIQKSSIVSSGGMWNVVKCQHPMSRICKSVISTTFQGYSNMHARYKCANTAQSTAVPVYAILLQYCPVREITSCSLAPAQHLECVTCFGRRHATHTKLTHLSALPQPLQSDCNLPALVLIDDEDVSLRLLIS